MTPRATVEDPSFPSSGDLLAVLQSSLGDDPSPLRELWVYHGMVVARSRRLGFCTSLNNARAGLLPGSRHDTYDALLGQPIARVVAQLMSSDHALDRSLAMACLDSAMPVPPGVVAGKATDLLAPRLVGRRICFVGHFPRADVWRDQGLAVDVVEMDPRPGDVAWDDTGVGAAASALARAEVVFVTGQVLVNGTLTEVVARSPRARWRVLMGPSVALCPGLLDLGIDVIGGSLIRDEAAALRYWQRGGFGIRRAPAGVIEPVCLLRDPRRLSLPRPRRPLDRDGVSV